MCEMNTALAALTLAGGVMKGVAAQQAAGANAATLESNAALAEAARADSLARGGQEAGRIRTRGTQTEASQTADYSASGVSVKSGSAVDVGASTEAVSELDAELAKNNAMREAFGYESQASNFRRQAAYTRQEGDMAEVTSVLGGVVGGASYLRPLLKVS
jgi:hypothetical protein